MMLFRHGDGEGRADGAADAALGRPARPRPSLMLAVGFPGYRDGYLSGYREAYRQRRWKEEQLRAEGLGAKEKHGLGERAASSGGNLPKRAKAKEDAAFDAGWRDGRDGADPNPQRITQTPDGVAAYQRGHRIGQRDRDYARAAKLRVKGRRDNNRNR